jgi:uncharacterized protein YbjT (DUF2867 family)
MQMDILMLGATGLVGGYLLELALKNDAIEKVKVLTRRPIKKTSSKLEQVLVDFEDLEKFPDVFKVDMIFCCLGTTIKKAGSKENFRKVDYEYPLKSARLAKQNGVSKFIMVTALGSNKKSPIFYSRVKGEVESEIKNLGIDQFIVIRPSLIMGERFEKRKGEKIGQILMKTLNPCLPGPLKKYRGVEAKEIAEVMLCLGIGEKPKTEIEYEIF